MWNYIETKSWQPDTKHVVFVCLYSLIGLMIGILLSFIFRSFLSFQGILIVSLSSCLLFKYCSLYYLIRK